MATGLLVIVIFKKIKNKHYNFKAHWIAFLFSSLSFTLNFYFATLCTCSGPEKWGIIHFKKHRGCNQGIHTSSKNRRGNMLTVSVRTSDMIDWKIQLRVHPQNHAIKASVYTQTLTPARPSLETVAELQGRLVARKLSILCLSLLAFHRWRMVATWSPSLRCFVLFLESRSSPGERTSCLISIPCSRKMHK